MNHKDVMQAYRKVLSIDFSPIRMKLEKNEHGESWDKDKINEAELLYQAYLSLVLASWGVDLLIAPPVSADEFWHQHILDTRKYMEDCKILFGEYLHHFPYFGMRGEEDAKALRLASETMSQLLDEHFSQLAEYQDIFGKYISSAECNNCVASCSSCQAFLAVA
jgi:hypothetical protein